MVGQGGRRDPAKEQFWRDTVQQQKHSGLSIRAFCDQESLKPGAFSWWRRELAKRDREKQTTTSRPKQREASPFVPVQLVPDPSQNQNFTAIEIVLPAGPTVRVPSGFDTQALTGVLDVLESRSC